MVSGHKVSEVQGGSNMTGTDLFENKPVTVPVIFEPPCIWCFSLQGLEIAQSFEHY